MVIQWYPGHMAKARREVEEKLNLVDFVIELVDARIPFSSQNPMLKDMIQDKPKITLLMKKDLADERETEKWLQFIRKNNALAASVDANSKHDINRIIRMAKELKDTKLKALNEKGVLNRSTRAMIIGIPNVGKSTLINRLAHKKATKIGDRPGITKQQLWIKIRDEFELLDTPGILWPKFSEQLVGYRLAAIGTIKDDILPLDDIAAFVITFLDENYPNRIQDRYNIEVDMTDMWEVFTSIGKARGALESGGTVNFDKVSKIILGDLRSGKLGKLTFETVENKW
ncbi:MAG TPA: ribosome biogenesis GTPase YlqF [Bacillota bacterium]|nr:ribosome biogenesis GTPase YlqF [Bacillota bacterium]